MKIYMDGKFVDQSAAMVSVCDHGYLYGDGIFEGIQSYNGNVFCLQQHLKRLYQSAKAISLTIPQNIASLTEAVHTSLEINQLKDAYIRLIVSRGEGDLGLDPRKCKQAKVVIISDKISLYSEQIYRDGLDIIISSTRKNSIDALNPQIKSLNYLNNILAKIESIQKNAMEALMLNKDGYVAECTGENIFMICNNKLITPPVHVGILNGITRQVVIRLAKENLKLEVQENLFTPYDLYQADEIFLTGTAAEIISVRSVNGKEFGTENAKQWTTQLQKEFKKITRIW